MTSIFDLPNDLSELPSVNQGIDEYRYRKISPLRGISDNNGWQNPSFPNNEVHFRWSNTRGTWWTPQRSYVRIRARMTKPDNTQLVVADAVAPAMNMAACLFQSAKFFINDVEVTSINTYLPQIDTLENRLSKNKEWLDGIGATLNFWDADFNHRIADVTADGVRALPTYTYGGQVNVDTMGLNVAGGNSIETNAAGWIQFTQTGGAAIPNLSFFNAGDQIDINFGAPAPGLVRYTLQYQRTAASWWVVETVPTVAAQNVAVNYYPRLFNTENARRVVGFELIWQPQLAIFKSQYAMPLGKYELRLTPINSSVYRKYAIESINANKTPTPDGAANDFDLYIRDCDLFISTMKAGQMRDGQYLLDLDETVCNARDVLVGTNDFTQEVSPSTYALSVAFQDATAGQDTQYSLSILQSSYVTTFSNRFQIPRS
jgi:hypothetical protein